MAKRLLSGGEAVAFAALEAGASVIAGYPSDSLSRLIESALRQTSKRNASGAYAQWTVNDTTTLGICAASSISGLRSLAAFSQTGFSETIQGITALNHAEIQGGLVVVVADEPVSDAFTTNLDVRRICELAKIPIIDPGTPEQAFSSVSAAFVLSEKFSMPVVVHISAEINNTSTFFDVQTHTKAAYRRGSFRKNKETLDVADLLMDESQEYMDSSGNDLSDTDIRLKEIAYRFSYKDIFTVYNRIYEFEQQYEGKHNSKRFADRKDDGKKRPDGNDASGMSALDESTIKIGICICGSAAPYAIEAIETLRREAHKSKVSTPFIKLLTLGTPFPVPKRTLRRFLDGLNDILVIEEFSSFAEEELIKQSATNFLGPNVHGRFTDQVNYNYPINFETTIMHIAAFIDKCLNVKPEKPLYDEDAKASLSPVVNLGKHSSPPDNSKNLTPKQSRTLTGIARRLASPEAIYTYNYDIPDRPPVLCAGCPHRASFFAIDKALSRLKIPRNDVVFSGDAGCSLLGNNPPLNFLDSYIGEGFSSSLAQGFSLGMPDLNGNAKSVAIMGDSSFFADAISGITNAVVNNIDITIIVLDNKTCAESGLQPTPTSNDTIDAAAVLRSLGIQNVREANPFEFANAIDSCVKALRDMRPSAVVLSSKCARMLHTNKVSYINVNKCTGCKECITQLGCPAISFDANAIGKKSGTLGQAVIDINQCNGCRLCLQACPSEAIRVMMHKDVAELIRQEKRRASKGATDKIMDFKGDSDGKPNETASAANGSEDGQEEVGFDLSFSNPLMIIEEEPIEPESDGAEADSGKEGSAQRTIRPSKEYVQADFGTLFGGRNAELRLNFDDSDEVLEESFEADVSELETKDDDTIEDVEGELEEDAVEDEETDIEDGEDNEGSTAKEDADSDEGVDAEEGADSDEGIDAEEDADGDKVKKEGDKK